MPKYKLTYFNFRARAEVSRFLFAVAGVEYEDFRIERSDWPAYKSGSPFGQIPFLEVDGKVICQSHSIERYLAKTFGLSGSNVWDEARVDMIVECLEDFRRSMIAILKENDEQKKETLKQNFLSEGGAKFLGNFERTLKENDSWKEGHFVGNALTLADIAFFNVTSEIERCIGEVFPQTWDQWPGLKTVIDRTAAHPKIKQWLDKRPQTSF